jgi:hypothetical protein
MTDEAGNVYEMSGQQLRRLGELVSDEHGRIFEIQKTVMAHIAETTVGAGVLGGIGSTVGKASLAPRHSEGSLVSCI